MVLGPGIRQRYLENNLKLYLCDVGLTVNMTQPRLVQEERLSEGPGQAVLWVCLQRAVLIQLLEVGRPRPCGQHHSLGLAPGESEHRSRPTCIHFPLLDCGWRGTRHFAPLSPWCPCCDGQQSGTVTEINPFSSKWLLIGVLYHSSRNESRPYTYLHTTSVFLPRPTTSQSINFDKASSTRPRFTSVEWASYPAGE